jgi:hypothetical protein
MRCGCCWVHKINFSKEKTKKNVDESFDAAGVTKAGPQFEKTRSTAANLSSEFEFGFTPHATQPMF